MVLNATPFKLHQHAPRWPALQTLKPIATLTQSVPIKGLTRQPTPVPSMLARMVWLPAFAVTSAKLPWRERELWRAARLALAER